MSVCEAELCHRWTGQGCICGVLGMEPAVTCPTCGSVCLGEGQCQWCNDEEPYRNNTPPPSVTGPLHDWNRHAGDFTVSIPDCPACIAEGGELR